MKHQRKFQTIVSCFCALALLAVPYSAIAEGSPEAGFVNPVIITEVQTGAATASEEFVELYNTSADPVDITGWQIRYVNAGGAADATTLLATVAGEAGARVTLPSHAYFVLHSTSITLPIGVVGQAYEASLSKSDKTIGLFARNEEACQMVAQDAVAWETVSGATLGEGPAVVATNAGTHILLQRYLDTQGRYVDANNNAHDFLLSLGTPGADNPKPVLAGDSVPGSASMLASFAASGCAPPVDPPIDPPAEDPIQNEGLDGLQITELLPNPGPNYQEPEDEFIELYNPNDERFQLAGYTIEVGITTKTRYTFTSGVIEPLAYTAFYNPETGRQLVNSNGQVRFFDPAGELLFETDAYASAANDKSWALIDDLWQWAAPSPNAANSTITPPGQDPVPNPPNHGLSAPQITELLPAPSADQLEFIELYNPNDSVFDLNGYILEVQTTTTRRHIFTAGVLLQPKAHTDFFSDEVNVTLANKGAVVRLLDSNGVIIAESIAYSNAKENQAWVFMDGAWQWTTSPSPGAANILTAVAPKIASATTAKKKATTPKSTAKTKEKATKDEDEKGGALLASTTPSDPLHPGVLAGVALFAVLYGAYEYRNDVASRIRQFRSNRTARATVGSGAQRRRSD